MTNDRLRTAWMVGCVLIILGILIIFRGGFYNLGYFVDLHGYNVSLGIALCGFGVFFILTGFRKKPKDYVDEFLICPNCETSFNKEDIADQQCPQCNVKLENLEGVYERHPELKNGMSHFKVEDFS